MAALRHGRVSFAGVLGLAIGVAYALVPIAATGWFSLRAGGDRLSVDAYTEVLRDPAFRESLALSVKLAVFTIALTVPLVTVTAYWVHLTLPRLRSSVEFLSVLPIVVPPIVLVVGLLRGFSRAPVWFYGSYAILVAAYAVLALPYVYRVVDSGLQGLNLRTLTEAALSLGATWPTVLIRVILPGMRPAMLSAAFLTFAIVLGEFTMALIMQFTTYAVYLSYVWESQATGAAALSVISFLITWAGMFAIVLVGNQLGRGSVHIGGTR